MAVCVLCSSLDDSELFQEALRELSWITEDVSVLYKENSTKIEKIKKLNEELEEFLNNQLENSYDDSHEDKANFTDAYDVQEDDTTANADEVWRKELNSLEKDTWFQKEVYLREQLMQQLLSLSQDISTLQHRHLQPLHHHMQPHLQRHLWGHQTLQWRPPSPASPTTARKTRRTERLMRWLRKRMPRNLIDLHS